MLPTYPGILRDGQIDWERDAPPSTPLRVLVTVLEPATNGVDRGRRMAEALERIALSGTTPSIVDPVDWQKEIRTDRDLPGRND